MLESRPKFLKKHKEWNNSLSSRVRKGNTVKIFTLGFITMNSHVYPLYLAVLISRVKERNSGDIGLGVELNETYNYIFR